jgi:hypothetical protein
MTESPAYFALVSIDKTVSVTGVIATSIAGGLKQFARLFFVTVAGGYHRRARSNRSVPCDFEARRRQI